MLSVAGSAVIFNPGTVTHPWASAFTSSLAVPNAQYIRGGGRGNFQLLYPAQVSGENYSIRMMRRMSVTVFSLSPSVGPVMSDFTTSFPFTTFLNGNTSPRCSTEAP